jgi:hypothetical protein
MDDLAGDLRKLTWCGWILAGVAIGCTFICGLSVTLSVPDDFWPHDLLAKRIFAVVLLGLSILPGVIVFAAGCWILPRIGLAVWKREQDLGKNGDTVDYS